MGHVARELAGVDLPVGQLDPRGDHLDAGGKDRACRARAAGQLAQLGGGQLAGAGADGLGGDAGGVGGGDAGARHLLGHLDAFARQLLDGGVVGPDGLGGAHQAGAGVVARADLIHRLVDAADDVLELLAPHHLAGLHGQQVVADGCGARAEHLAGPVHQARRRGVVEVLGQGLVDDALELGVAPCAGGGLDAGLPFKGLTCGGGGGTGGVRLFLAAHW